MDIRSLMDMVPWKLVFIGGASLVGLVVAVRVMRRGLSTFEDAQHAMQNRIRKTREEIAEGNKSISLQEQLHLMDAAVREMALMAGKAEEIRSGVEGREVCVRGGGQTWRIGYAPRKAHLHSSNRELYGVGAWRVRCVEGARAALGHIGVETAPPPAFAGQKAAGAGGTGASEGVPHIVIAPAPAYDATTERVLAEPCAAGLMARHGGHRATVAPAGNRTEDGTEGAHGAACVSRVGGRALTMPFCPMPDRAGRTHPAFAGQDAAIWQEFTNIDDIIRYLQKALGLPCLEGPLPVCRTPQPAMACAADSSLTCPSAAPAGAETPAPCDAAAAGRNSAANDDGAPSA